MAIAVIGAISYVMLWSAYGFRYAARPGNAPLTPTTSAFLETLHRPFEARMIGFSEQHHHLLPEAYLYGLTDVAVLTSEGRPAFLFGKLYPTGKWFYFPSTFLIKNTLGFLLLLALALTAAHLWRKERARELLFLLLPAGLYFMMAIFSRLDIGHRHILPIYPFLIVFIAGGAAVLLRRSRAWAGIVAVLLVMHVVSSLRAFPAYLPYSNEAWGGPSQHVEGAQLTPTLAGPAGSNPFSNTFGSTASRTAGWPMTDRSSSRTFTFRASGCRRSSRCSFDRRRGLCRRRSRDRCLLLREPMSGFGWGPEEVNPYAPFVQVKPDDEIQGEILVYNGSYSVPRVAALSHLAAARQAAAGGHANVALAEAQQAEALAPDLIGPHEALTDLYAANHRQTEAEREYVEAMRLYTTVYAAYSNFVQPPVDPSAPSPTGR